MIEISIFCLVLAITIINISIYFLSKGISNNTKSINLLNERMNMREDIRNIKAGE